MSVVWLSIAACASCGLGVNGESSILEETPEVWEEVKVVLESATYVDTRRLSAGYQFRVTERINETFGFERPPNGLPSRPGTDPDVFGLHLDQGSDVDNEGRDSISRLNMFFDVIEPRNPRAYGGSPLTILNTNVVTLRAFSRIWLFSDDRGRVTAIDRSSSSPRWESRLIMERFGGSEQTPLIYLSRHTRGQSLAVLLQHKDLDVRLAALHALPREGKDAIEPLLQHFFFYADGVMDHAQIIGRRVDPWATAASRWHYRQAEAAVHSLGHWQFAEYADDIVPRLRPYQDAAKYSPQLASAVNRALRILAPRSFIPPEPDSDASKQWE